MRMPAFTLRGFKRPCEVAGAALGKLERQVMDLVWQQDETSVRDVYEAFGCRVAYTTVMTTMHRLYKKGVLSRRKQNRAFLYVPRFSAHEFEQGIARDLIEGLMDRAANGVEPLLACIVDAVSEQDRASLDELERLIHEKKRALKRIP